MLVSISFLVVDHSKLNLKICCLLEIKPKKPENL